MKIMSIEHLIKPNSCSYLALLLTKMLDYFLRTTQIVARSLQHVQYTIVIVKLSKIIQN